MDVAEVIAAFKVIPGVTAVYADAPSDEPGHRGHRYTITFTPRLADGARINKDALDAAAASLRAADPEFAWNATAIGLDDFPRTQVWPARVFPLNAPREVHVLQAARAAFEHIHEVVDVTCSPRTVVAAGEAVYMTVVLRALMDPQPVELLKAVDLIAWELRAEIPEVIEVQAAPELNYPPTAVQLADPNDPRRIVTPADILALMGAALRVLEAYSMVVAAWALPKGDVGRHSLFVYGEDDSRMLVELQRIGWAVVVVTNPVSVPRGAKCLFNLVTRILKAQAEGDATKTKYFTDLIRSSVGLGAGRLPGQQPLLQEPAIPAARKLVTAPPGMTATRGDPSTHYVKCRWCAFRIPASDNPAYNETCPKCSAIQTATSLPTRGKTNPLVQFWLNPDGSAYFDCVGAPPIEGRWDLASVRRFTLPASAGVDFEQNPMGRRTAAAHVGEDIL